MDIRRSDIKYSFLKELILRLDFEGLSDNDLRNTISIVRDNIYSIGYTNYREITPQNFSIHLNASIPLVPPDITTNPADMVYLYSNKDESETVTLTKTSLIVSSKFDIYSGIEKYMGAFLVISNSLSDISPFFRPLRLGLRKKNVCYLRELELLKEYFVPEIFNELYLLPKLGADKYIGGQKVDCLQKDNITLNYTRNIQLGNASIDGKPPEDIYQIILDLDAHVEQSESLLSELCDSEKCSKFLIHFNSELYEYFRKSLSDSFMSALSGDDFLDKSIVGVTKNG